jgi:GWxTD domain-containing protein
MDPNPNTEKNELMEEYFLRVNIANQNFSTLSQDGWQTDQGRIFIKFGEPDDIERHPFERNSPPFEVWRYYNLRKVFVFLDRTGFGDYYLHPSYLDEEFN